jgi:hypothetical protein
MFSLEEGSFNFVFFDLGVLNNSGTRVHEIQRFVKAQGHMGAKAGRNCTPSPVRLPCDSYGYLLKNLRKIKSTGGAFRELSIFDLKRRRRGKSLIAALFIHLVQQRLAL